MDAPVLHKSISAATLTVHILTKAMNLILQTSIAVSPSVLKLYSPLLTAMYLERTNRISGVLTTQGAGAFVTRNTVVAVKQRSWRVGDKGKVKYMDTSVCDA